MLIVGLIFLNLFSFDDALRLTFSARLCEEFLSSYRRCESMSKDFVLDERRTNSLERNLTRSKFSSSWKLFHWWLFESIRYWSFPTNVNCSSCSSCSNQRNSILQRDFLHWRRNTIPINKHEWFKVHRPDYRSPKRCEGGTNMMSFHVIQEVCEIDRSLFYLIHLIKKKLFHLTSDGLESLCDRNGSSRCFVSEWSSRSIGHCVSLDYR